MHYIYWIHSNTEGVTRCYVGQTSDFDKRKSTHKSNCNNDKSAAYNYVVYKYIRDNGGWDAFEIEVLEIIKDGYEETAGHRELYWIQQKHADLNKQMPTRTTKESQKAYYEQHKQQIIERHQRYVEEHKEQYVEYQQRYREEHKDKRVVYNGQMVTCECGCEVRKYGLKEHKTSQKHVFMMQQIQRLTSANK